MTTTTTTHRIGTREEWRAARLALLEREKEHTRHGDELAAARLALPWVPVEAPYVFDTEDGPRTLAELFGDNSQLITYHFMLGAGWTEGCPSCSAIADGVDLTRVHLEHHDVTWVAVSRAPLEEILAYKRRMGWTFPWVSSAGNDFNVNFHVSSTPAHPLREYNFRTLSPAVSEEGEWPGMSAFVRRDGVVHHTYSAYSRGLDAVWGMYHWLDRAPLGRNESGGANWFRRHDAYDVVVR